MVGMCGCGLPMLSWYHHSQVQTQGKTEGGKDHLNREWWVSLTSVSLSLWRGVMVDGADSTAGNTNKGEGGSAKHGSHHSKIEQCKPLTIFLSVWQRRADHQARAHVLLRALEERDICTVSF